MPERRAHEARRCKRRARARSADRRCRRFRAPRRAWPEPRSASPTTSRPSTIDAPGIGTDQPGDRAQRRRLSGAVRAEQSGHEPVGRQQRDVLHRDGLAVALLNAPRGGSWRVPASLTTNDGQATWLAHEVSSPSPLAALDEARDQVRHAAAERRVVRGAGNDHLPARCEVTAHRHARARWRDRIVNARQDQRRRRGDRRAAGGMALPRGQSAQRTLQPSAYPVWKKEPFASAAKSIAASAGRSSEHKIDSVAPRAMSSVLHDAVRRCCAASGEKSPSAARRIDTKHRRGSRAARTARRE